MHDELSNVEVPEVEDVPVALSPSAWQIQPQQSTAHVCPSPIGVQVVCDNCDVVIDSVMDGKYANTKRQFRNHIGHRWSFLVLFPKMEDGGE